jgi:DNA processing protein
VDAEAHRGALEVGGVTVAVLAGGVDRIYPPEHRDLAREICQSGAVLSEMPLGTPPRRELFPLRNRIISGLCRGVVVVEARSRSGSLITVRHALAQGREVFVLPGASEGPFAEGSNRLLRDGARAIRGAADVLEDLGMDSSQGAPGRGGGPSRGGLEDLILSLLGDAPRDRERLLVEVKADPGRLAAALLGLELAGHVVEERDGRLYRAW